uniref:MAM domain-containing protein n=1 Tax=Steinernema glaseri TaxID=37863 RepID=A0A1I8AN78_9BILA
MQNGPSVLFAELKNDVFWRHDWTEVRIQEPFYTLSFRHRFSCKEGFLGNICEYRVPEPTEAPSTTTQAQTVEASTTTEALLQSTYSSPPPKPTTAPPTLPSSTISTRLFPKAEEPFPLLPIANELATLAQE